MDIMRPASGAVRCVDPAYPSPVPGVCGCDDTTRQYKTHNAEQCEVHYPWHPWFGRTIWVYRKVIRRTRSVAHCGPDRIQCAKSLEIPLWMLEAASCSALRLAEDAAVDCAALQRLKALLFGGVVEDRHSSLARLYPFLTDPVIGSWRRNTLRTQAGWSV